MAWLKFLAFTLVVLLALAVETIGAPYFVAS